MGLVVSTTPSDSKESSASEWPTQHVCQNFSEPTQLNRKSISRKLWKLCNLVIGAYAGDEMGVRILMPTTTQPLCRN